MSVVIECPIGVTVGKKLMPLLSTEGDNIPHTQRMREGEREPGSW